MLKPKVLKTIHDITKEYNKLIKYQKDTLYCILNSKTISKLIGQFKTKIEEAILDGEIENNHQAAYDFMLSIKDEILVN